MPQAVNEAVVLLRRVRCAHNASAFEVDNVIEPKAAGHAHGIGLVHVWSRALRSLLCIAVRASLSAVEDAERVRGVRVANPSAVAAFEGCGR